jgi:hypothetical protein
MHVLAAGNRVALVSVLIELILGQGNKVADLTGRVPGRIEVGLPLDSATRIILYFNYKLPVPVSVTEPSRIKNCH